MIKLNNKNITYVALADSNNSIKAPKEIWYADSNNSVKLVYRRKDALIEGEDYEKYHWLNGRNGAYINTMHKLQAFDDAFEIEAKIDDPTVANPDGGENDIFGYMQGDGKRCIAFYGNSYLVFAYSNVLSGGNQILLSNKPYFKARLSADGQTLTANVNGQGYTQTVGNFSQGEYGYVGLFRIGIQQNNHYFHGDIASFRISDPTFTTNKINLIPCKLLKPIPKWLDANGIRRQVGECGMIDLVSGKFYGNVNSVGTFTVENYYERKEWLVGDGSAYIDTGHNVNEDLDYETNVHLLPDTYLFWYRSGSPYYDQTMVARSNTINTGVRIAKNSNDIRSSDTANVEVQWNNNEVLVNGVNYIPSNRATTFNYDLYLFRAYLADTSSTNYSSNNVKCSYFRFLDSNRNYIQNLIPCTLTMDLPASMDANNIARTKGTCGMWDLVSDRFYGNVANSGTFKAVNLAEGVDYEVHDWLKTELVGTNAKMMILPVHSYSFSFSRKMTSGKNVPYFYTEGSTPSSVYLNTTNYHTIQIWDSTQGLYYSSGQSFDRNDAISIVSTTNGLKVNSQSIPQNTFPVQSISFGASDTNGTENYTSSITVDGIERYIPVKLLKSIPSKYDANGIARQVGECGMYDTVNDKFYGNVASSGTFSVSDDN